MPDPVVDQKLDQKVSTPQTFDIPSGEGKSVKMTLEEMQTAAAKATGADRKFQEAADLRKEFGDLDPISAKEGARIARLAKSLQDGTATDRDAESLLKSLGFNDDAIKAIGEGKPAPKKAEAKIKVRDEDLDPSLKVVFDDARDAAIRRTEEAISEKVRKCVDKDPVITKMIGAVPVDRRDRFVQTLYDKAIEITLGQVYQGSRVSPELLQSAVQRLRTDLDSLGIPTESNPLPLTHTVRGLEHAVSEIGSNEPIKRVPIGTDGSEENAIKRFAQKMMQSLTKSHR